MELAAILRATVSLTYLVGTLVAVMTAWVKLEESPEQSIERVAREQGRCGPGQFECEKQLKSFETCSALNPNDAALCEAVELDGNPATCTGVGAGDGATCEHNARPGVRAGPPLCIPNELIRNGYYDCIGTVEACTAIDEDIAADVAKCAAVALDGTAATCTNAGDCKYWGKDVVSDFSDEKALQWQMFRLVAVIAIIGGALLVFSFYKLISTTVALYRKPKDPIKDAAGGGGQDRYKQP